MRMAEKSFIPQRSAHCNSATRVWRLLRCMSQHLAQTGGSLQRSEMSAIGGYWTVGGHGDVAWN